MQIRSVAIKKYKAISDLKIEIESVTALMGGNNAGKSTILRAISLFFEAAPKLDTDDFFDRNADEIEISITFHNLNNSEKEEFGSAVINDEITISRVFSNDKNISLAYSVLAKTYPAFNEIRSIQNKTEKRAAYNALSEQLNDLERAATADQADTFMANWEQMHPDLLEEMLIRGFFGAPNVANGKLRKKTALHYIPAVADAGEQTSDVKKSPIIQLLADIAKQMYENRKEVQDFILKTNEAFEAMVAPEKFPELAAISHSLTASIQKYYHDSKLMADWQLQNGIQVSFPQPIIRVEDNGFITGLQNVGHGLQRAALFSVIEFMARKSMSDDGEEFQEAQSDIILMIEEPEIYQHPHKQQVICNAFHEICEGFNLNTGIRFQIIFATHSEKFVKIDKFKSIRIIRRLKAEEEKIHKSFSVNVATCSQYFADLLGKGAMTDEAFEAKMHIFSREVCEGFFANKIILVEGVTDKAILEGAYKYHGRDPYLEGISIISVDGKTKMDKPLFIFNRLGIPTYAVFDSDFTKKKNKQKPETNLLLQKICGIIEPVEFPNGCFDRFSAYEQDLEAYLKATCGELWEAQLDELALEYGLGASDLCKTPLAVQEICRRCYHSGIELQHFKDIIDFVDRLEV